MPKRDRYRRETWSEADETDFEARLGRARSWNRAQYLRIQAVHLAETGGRRLIRVALGLLDRMFEEYPDSIDIAPAHGQRARANVMTDAWLGFGWLVVEYEMVAFYDEALAVLEEFHEDVESPFPVHAHREHGIRAILAGVSGEPELARREAAIALADAGR